MIETIFMGRLGNNLFQYAVARTVAERSGYNFHIITDSHKWGVFSNLFNVSMGARDGDIKQKFSDINQNEFDPSVFGVEDFTLLYGFFPSEKYFDHRKARQWFTPKIKAESPHPFGDYCFIHFRGGDYNLPLWNLRQLPKSYYDEAKEKILQIQPDLRFIIVTDDFNEAKKRFPDDVIISDSAEKDFVLLTSAKYLIISNSTFSWWAAWLNENNIVIAPHGWHNYNINKDVFAPMDIKVNRFIWI